MPIIDSKVHIRLQVRTSYGTVWADVASLLNTLRRRLKFFFI